MTRRSIVEFLKTVGLALALALVIRVAVAQPFRIPSGSMQPTLAVGDYIVVTKWAYGYSRYSVTPLQGVFGPGRLFGGAPRRGDVVVFRPRDADGRDFVKRVVGLPRDRIQMQAGRLYINGEPVPREDLGSQLHVESDGSRSEVRVYREQLPGGSAAFLTFDRGQQENGNCVQTIAGERQNMCALDNTDVFVVPEGHFFMMGDDRDFSDDSRAHRDVRFVPIDNLVGRAEFVFVSFDHTVSVINPLTWVSGFRGERFLAPVK